MFAAPEERNHVSHSMVRWTTEHGGFTGAVRRLPTIMQALRHTEIALLKMDIEGAEYAVLEDISSSTALIRQLLVESHHRWRDIGLPPTRDAAALLRNSGHRLAHVSPSGTEYTFLGQDYAAWVAAREPQVSE